MIGEQSNGQVIYPFNRNSLIFKNYSEAAVVASLLVCISAKNIAIFARVVL